MPYRKVNDTTTWHWCYNCSNWPADNFEEHPYQQTSGDYCPECEQKTAHGECQRTEEVGGFK